MSKEEFIHLTIGKPWANRACSFSEIDCWGLVYLYYISVLELCVNHSESYKENSEFTKCFDDEVIFWKLSENPVDQGIFVAYIGAVPVHVGLIIDGSAYHSRAESSHVRFDKIRTIEKLFTKVEYYTYANH